MLHKCGLCLLCNILVLPGSLSQLAEGCSSFANSAVNFIAKGSRGEDCRTQIAHCINHIKLYTENELPQKIVIV